MGLVDPWANAQRLLLLLLLFCCSSEQQQQISKRESSLIGIIETHANTLDVRKFYFDNVMVQGVAVTPYTNPRKKQEKGIVFGRRNPDAGKDAIVLSSAENQFAVPTPRGGKKRQFVLLKKSPNAAHASEKHGTPYYASFVYVRNLLQNDSSTDVFDLNGVQTVVEWDIWETRTRGFYAGWDTCDFTMLFTCESLKHMILKASKEMKDKPNPGKGGKRRRRKKRQASNKNGPKPGGKGNIQAMAPIQGEAGHDPNEYNDLYLDLDFHVFDEVPQAKPQGPATEAAKARRRRSVRVKRGWGWPPKPPAGKPSGSGGFNMGGGGGGGRSNNNDDDYNGVNGRGGGGGGGGYDNGGNGGRSMNGGGGNGGGGMNGGGGNGGGGMNMNFQGRADNGGGGGGGGGFNPMAMFTGGGNPMSAFMGGKGNPLSAFTGGGGGNPLSGLANAVGGIANTVGGMVNPIAQMAGGLAGGLGGGGNLESMIGGANPFSSIMAGLGGGEGGGDPLSSIMGGLGNAGNMLGGLTGGLGNVGNMLGGITGGLGNVGNMLGGITGGLGNVGNMLGGLTGGLGNIGGMLGGLTGGGNPLSSIMGGMTGEGKGDLLSSMMAGIDAKANPFSSILGSLGGAAEGNPLGAITGMLGAANPLGTLLGGNPLAALGNLGGGGSPLDGLLGGLGGLGGEGGLGGMLGGLTGGKDGPLGMIGGIVSSVAGASGVLGGLLDPAGQILGGLGDTVKGLAEGLGGGVVGIVSGEGGIADSIGGVMSGILGGPDGPLGMAAKMLGPVFSMLDPVNAVVATVNGLARDLPGIGLSLGHMVIGGLAPIMDTIGIGSLIESVGLGPVLDMVGGVSDAIISTGESLLGCWDSVGNGLIDGAAEGLTRLGIPPEVAKLAALGAQTAFNVDSLKAKGIGLGVRLGADMIGSTLNGGRNRGAGAGAAPGNVAVYDSYMNTKGMPSNAKTLFGVSYPGADNGKRFFFPEGALSRSMFKSDLGTLLGWFETGVPEKYDRFHPDDEGEAQKMWGKRGKIIPDTYKQPHRDADNGIDGKFDRGNVFYPESPSREAVYNPEDLDARSMFWAPPELEKKRKSRPKAGKDGKSLVYGVLFNGIEGSPHVFVAEGDTLTGFFVPEDEDHPDASQTPHGVFIPNSPAGHAVMVVDDDKDMMNMKSIRGAFFPDAMNLAGAISGRLSRTEDDSRYSFVLDRPGVEFVYTKGHPSTKGVWAPFLNGQEWKYVAPPVAPPSGGGGAEGGGGAAGAEEGGGAAAAGGESRRRRKRDGLVGGLVGGLGLAGKKDREEFGTKLTSQKTDAFLPKGYPIEGVLVPVDSKTKYLPMVAKLEPEKPNTAWKVSITQKSPGAPEITAPVVGLFVPTGYPKQDAVIGLLVLEANQESGQYKIVDKQKPTEHFWTPGQEVWTPAGFAEKAAQGGNKTEGGGDAGGGGGGDQTVPGVASEPVKAPEKPTNYHFGHKFENVSEMEENKLEEMPHSYDFGAFYVDSESEGPLFIPEGGGVGVFTPDGDGAEAQKGFFFPKRNGGPSRLVMEKPDAVPDGTAGKFSTECVDGKISTDFVRGELKGGGEFGEAEGTEVVPGWRHAIVKTEDIPDDAKGDAATPTKKKLKYALVDIGGGLKGVVVDGAEALDDANNPVFQEYLLYRAQQAGDINPWGDVLVVEPVSREAAEKGLGAGKIGPAKEAAPNAMEGVLSGFSLDDWAWPLANEESSGKVVPPMKLGNKRNVASMMDFRSYVAKKYTCKRASIDDKSILLMTPLGAEPFISITKQNSPKPEWLAMIKESGQSIVLPESEGVLGMFTQMFKLDLEEMKGFEKQVASGGGGPASAFMNMVPGMGAMTGGGSRRRRGAPDDWAKSASFDEWGDEHICDEIELDQLTAAQALSSLDDSKVTGVDIGMQLIQNVGNKMEYAKVARKLYESVQATQKQPPGNALDNLGTTDLLGGVGKAVSGGVAKKQGGGGGGGGGASGKVKREAKVLGKKQAKKAEAVKKYEQEELNLPSADNLPGWKTQHRELKPNATFSDDGVIFYGVGNCKQEATPPLSLFESKVESNVIDYYLTVLRIDCMPVARAKITSLFNDGFLSFSDSNDFFDINSNNKLINQPRLTPDELKKLSLAFEFSAFSNTYHTLRTNGFPTAGVITEPNTVISRSVGFLTEMALYYINRARIVSPSHSVRLTRNLLKTLRTVLTKLHQDQVALEKKCGQCTFDIFITKGDKFRIVSLIEFIIHGLGPFEKGEAELKPSFYSFIKLNKEAIKKRIELFEKNFPKA